MTDYLGPLTLGLSGTYVLTKWTQAPDASTADLEVIVSATTADTLAVALEALVAQLYQGNTYVHSQPGVTNPTVYRVLAVGGMKVDDLNTWLGFWQRVSFTLALSGSPQGAFSALFTSEHWACPGSTSLSGLLGTNPTMLDVSIYDDSGNDMHSVMAALAPTALSDSKWVVLSSWLSWTTLTAGTGADFWADEMGYTTSASAQTAVLDTSQYPSGKYRLWARVQQSAGVGYVKDSQNDTWVAVTKTTPHLVCIGDLDLPTRDSKPGTSAPLTLSVKSDGTNTFTLNAFVILPLSWGYFSWHDTSSPTGEIDHIEVGPSGVWQDGAANAAYLLGGPLTPTVLATHCGTLVPTASPAGSWPAAWGRTAGNRMNYCTNPSFVGEGGTAGLAALWEMLDNVSGTPTPTLSASGQRIEYTGDADTAKVIQLDQNTAAASFAEGEPATVSCLISGALTGCTMRLYLLARAAGSPGAALTSVYTAVTPTATPTPYSAVFPSLPATTDHLQAYLYVSAIDTGDTADFTTKNVLIEKTATVRPFFDGHFPSASWTGTHDASTSTDGEVAVDESGLLFGIAAAAEAHSHYVYWPPTTAEMPLVVPGAWMELLVTRQVTTWVSGSAIVYLQWFDVDGNSVSSKTLDTAITTDASPVPLELYAKVPVHASRVRIIFATSSGAEMTVYYSAVTLRRCPMRLIVVAEDASGTLVSHSHPVHVTVNYTPRYELAR